MKMGVNTTETKKYNSYRSTKSLPSSKYTRILKPILIRKKTSNLRISQNHRWNQDEDRYYIRVTQFNLLDFCNEINDNYK